MMWWLIGSAPEFWGRGHGAESGISYNDPDALQLSLCHNVENIRVERETYTHEAKKKKGIYIFRLDNQTQIINKKRKNLTVLSGSNTNVRR